MSGPGANVNSIDAVRKYPNVVASNKITSVLKSLYNFRCNDANVFGGDAVKAIVNGRAILPDADGNFFIDDRSAIIFDDHIREIGSTVEGCDVLDAEGKFVAPGFINVHIHGCAGADTMDDCSDALSTMRNFLPSTGVTSFLPTTMTMPLENIYSALDHIRREKNKAGGAKILGANVEGPFISKKFKGAQDEKNILRAEFNLIEPFADVIKIITVAPEELDDCNFIDECRRYNIIVSIGHSAADYQTALDAINRGARHITHLFNAQTGLHHRRPGIVGAALDTNAVVELIADNVHVHPAVQRIVSRIKPRGEIVLITDSLRACGLGDGTYDLGGQTVTVKGTLATLDDGTIAASVAPMNTVVKNFWCNTQWALENVIECVTKNPAVELGLYKKIGSLEVGKAADIIIFDDELNIRAAFVDGRRL